MMETFKAILVVLMLCGSFFGYGGHGLCSGGGVMTPRMNKLITITNERSKPYEDSDTHSPSVSRTLPRGPASRVVTHRLTSSTSGQSSIPAKALIQCS